LQADGRTAKGLGTPSAATQVAQAIREDIFRMEDGEFIGSEEDLIARYGVSRPTLRQASGLLIQERLITARRGVRGGFFARRPDIGAVSHIVALYLRSHQVSVAQLIHTMLPIRAELARLAAASSDEEARDALIAFLKAEREAGPPNDFALFTQAERNFNTHLAKMSGNITLALFLDILLDLSAMVHREADVYRDDPDRLLAYRRARDLLADAVLDRDPELAALAAHRCTELTSRWVIENLASDMPRTRRSSGA
jgi:DNA-binding FadR family transcriptional regulator